MPRGLLLSLSLVVWLVTAPANAAGAPVAVMLDCAAAVGAPAPAAQVAAALCTEIAAQIEAGGHAVATDGDAADDAVELRLTVLAATATVMRARIAWRRAAAAGAGDALDFRVVDRAGLPPEAMRQFAHALITTLPRQIFSDY